MDYLTTKEASIRRGIKDRRIMVLSNENRIDGAIYACRIWLIPKEAEKPAGARIKSGKYIVAREDKAVKSKEGKEC